MSLVPKIDEGRELILRNLTLALITETWLKESISDGVIDIPDFTVLHRDRVNEDHGGVCAYIKDGECKYKQLNDLKCCDAHECLWIHLHPHCLPRGFSCIIAAVIYHPPKDDDNFFCNHLFLSLALVESKYPN